MTKFLVTCTKIYNGTMFVDAENSDEALNIAQDNLNENVDCINWDFGEATADIADEEEPENKDCNGVEESRLSPDYEHKYNVGEYIVWHHYDYETCTEKDDIFQITDIKNGKYICSDGKQDVCDFLDYHKDFRLAEPTEISNYFKAHHKYKVGECVGNVRWGYLTITEIKDGKYIFENGDEEPIATFDANEDNHIETFHREDFQPFDKVLVRDDNRCVWVCAFFSHIDYSSEEKPYVTCGGEHWEQCVPYNNDTALYLGTKQDYNGKYQTW